MVSLTKQEKKNKMKTNKKKVNQVKCKKPINIDIVLKSDIDKSYEAMKAIALLMSREGFTFEDIIGAIDGLSEVLVVIKVLNLRDNGRSVRWIARSMHKSEKYVSTLIKKYTDRACNGEHKTTCCEKKCQNECKKACEHTCKKPCKKTCKKVCKKTHK